MCLPPLNAEGSDRVAGRRRGFGGGRGQGGEGCANGQASRNYRTAANGPGWASLKKVGARAKRKATRGGRGTPKEPKTERWGVVRQVPPLAASLW